MELATSAKSLTKDTADFAKSAVMTKLFKAPTSESAILWGLLHIKIVRCKNLRNLDKLGLKSLIVKRKKDLSDPYVTAWLEDYRLLKTRFVDDDLDPVFDEEFYCPVAHVTEGIKFKVKDKDVVKDESLGTYFLPVQELIQMNEDGDLQRVGVHKVVYLDGKKSHGSLEFFVEFLPVRMLAHTMEVPGVYFKQTKGNDVKLYMNADDDGSAPIVTYGEDAKVWKPPRLWRDIYDSICSAKHFIYMAGWSFDIDQYLLRGEDLKEAERLSSYPAKLGDLLLKKSEEGVVVNLMQWDDYSSNFAFPGMMGTYDEKTREFFQGTNVNSMFMSMEGGDVNTIFEGQNKKMAFTHHQKFIMMDTPKKNGDGGKELLAFVGGIDLTEGRWDNRKHPLFRTLQMNHKGDTYGKCFRVSKENGPRQPWHDIHSSVRGPEALDLIQAFSERWTKQAPQLVGELVNLHRIGLGDATTLENDGGWYTQLSRSIDSRVNAFDVSVKQSFQNIKIDQMGAFGWTSASDKKAEKSRRFVTNSNSLLSYNRCLDQKKGRLVDTSIHMTNIHHIRRAKHFIYIESQYFMGSSFMWSNSSERDVKCHNMVAAELTMKICDKIAAREPFAVYILLPMWMEGIPDAAATQGLLYWQRVTIEAMYQKVHEALQSRMANSPDHGLKVSDYLNFYCLGTRETSEGSQATGVPTTEDEKLLAKTRRHQIYIHSKMMIVDDEVCLIGTANINQRSLDGCRDSEIMMTSWQPDHLASEKSIAHGDIHAYRLHIWASITDQMNDAYRDPSSPECVKLVNSIADSNFKKYMGEETVDMTSHLLPFPLEFYDGELRPRRGLHGGHLPDTDADAMGKKSYILPEMFLT